MEKQREGGSQKLVQKAKQRSLFFSFFFKGGEVGIRGRAAEGEAHNEAVLGRQHEGQ